MRRVGLKYAFIGVLLLSFLLYPMKELARGIAKNPDKEIYTLSQRLSKHKLSGSIAGNGNWGTTLALAHYLNLPYYGVLPDCRTKECRNDLFERYKIRYYFEWAEMDSENVSEEEASDDILVQEPPSPDLPGLRVYDITQRIAGRTADGAQ
jgi:hypothetical protein